MEAGSDEESNKIDGNGLSDTPKKPKRQMKTPFQLETLERTYASETYPSEATRAELSEKLGLTDRQLQMWFCHRRLKDKKEAVAKSVRSPEIVERRELDFGNEELIETDPGSDHGSRPGSGFHSGSGTDSGSRSSQDDYVDDVPSTSMRYYESPRSVIERRVIACIEAQLGEPIRKDGPILGVEFDDPPPGAFGAPIGVMAELRERSGHSYDSKIFDRYDSSKPIKAPAGALHEAVDSIMRYGVAPSHIYDSPIDGPGSRSLPFVQGNGQLFNKGYAKKAQAFNVTSPSEPVNKGRFSSPQCDNSTLLNEKEKKRKIDDARIEREVQANEKRIKKEIEKQDLLKRKREAAQMKKEMEKQDRERRKEEEKLMREKQRQEERFQREEKRETERREKFMQRELLKAERRKQKEELQREKEAARLKAALERATARRIAKESTELIEDERLELMELAAASKGLPSIVSLDYDTLQNLESFRAALCIFPPNSVKLKKPFAIQPWCDSDENIGNLLMVWRFCITFADILGLWPFTLDELVQALHDYESRLLGEIHLVLMKLIIKDIEDVARMPSGGPGTNQYTVGTPDGGHPQIVEGAYLWGFDISSWKYLLNPLTWPEILRQFALSAGYGPQLSKNNTEKSYLLDGDEGKGCEDVISTLRNGSAAEKAIAMMQEKGLCLQRRSRHRLTPGTVKFAAYHVLSLEGSEGLNVVELADKIQKSGLRDLTTSKTPEASISVALSRDPVLFERIAPSTYCVRPAFRKDPANADVILSAAREKMRRYENGFSAGENVADVERDDDSVSDAEGADIELDPPLNANQHIMNDDEIATSLVNGKDDISENAALYLQHEFNTGVDCNPDQEDSDIDESKSGEPWVQGLSEGEYTNLSVEERLNALVALIGLANEGSSIRSVLEDRLDAANALKKQMWAEAQLDKRRMKEESLTKLDDPSLAVAADDNQSPLGTADDKNHEASTSTPLKEEPSLGVDDVQNDFSSFPTESSLANDSRTQIAYLNQQNGQTAERSRMQLKSFISHRAEETYVYRSLPLGQDRRRNHYWQFVASASGHDPGSGRIFVESVDGCWRLIDTEEAFDALLTSLDARGIRESHLHIMLQKVENLFKDNLRSNMLRANVLDQKENVIGSEIGERKFSPSGSGSPVSSVCVSNSDSYEVSSSFRIEFGRNKTERKNALNRHLDLQIWMWKECFNSTTLAAMENGKRRCGPLLGFCDSCLLPYVFEEILCPCHRKFGTSGNELNLLDQVIRSGEKSEIHLKNLRTTESSCPPRITLLKAILTLVEVSVPLEALQSSWTEKQRKSWGMRLHNSSSMEDLLQILTQLEGIIKREHLSSNFETTGELLDSCVSTGSMRDIASPGSVPQLPWIPQTSAAVSLRLLELDASISYTNQKAESWIENRVVDVTRLLPTRVRMKNMGKMAQPGVVQHKEGNSNRLHRSKVKQAVQRQGRIRPRKGLQKRVAGSVSGSGRQKIRSSDTLSQVLMQHEQKVHIQKHARGRRTVRKRRTQNKAVDTTPQDRIDDNGNHRALHESPRNSVGEEWYGEQNGKVDYYSDTVDSDESDSDDKENGNTRFEYGNLNLSFKADYDRNRDEVNEMSDGSIEPMEEDNHHEDEDDEEDEDNEEGDGGVDGFENDENLEEDVEMNDESEENDARNETESSDSMVSGDYDD